MRRTTLATASSRHCVTCDAFTDVAEADEPADDVVSPGSESNMKITLAVTSSELAFIDDLLRPDPVAVVIKVGRVVSPQQNFELNVDARHLRFS